MIDQYSVSDITSSDKPLGYSRGSTKTNIGLISQLRQEQKIEEKLWHHGKEVGTVRGRVVFYNLPFLQQMKIGVLSNSGITFSTRPVLAAADVKI